MILVDTNVLIYAVNVDSPYHMASKGVLDAAIKGKIRGVLVPQVLLEFYAVVTDPCRVERPLSPETAWEQVAAFQQIFLLIDAGPKSLDFLKELAPLAKGADIFDAYIVAQMMAGGISLICTYNKKNFLKFPGVLAQTPEEILANLGMPQEVL